MAVPFITTFTGRKVNPLALTADDISVTDIAHHLSCINRFVGALREPVSVAQHSVYVYRLMPDYPRRGLFHDASEAYLGDVSKWVKHTEGMEGYRYYEQKAQAVIDEVFECEMGLDSDLALEEADRLMVRFEALRGLRRRGRIHLFEIPNYPEPTTEEIARIGKWRPWPWHTSEEAFLTAYRCIVNLAPLRRTKP